MIATFPVTMLFGRVYHLAFADGSRFYCRVLKKTQLRCYGSLGAADCGNPGYGVIPRYLPWQLTPEHDIPANFREGYWYRGG